MAQQEDITLQISKFGSQNSFSEPDAIEDSQMQYIVNFYHKGNKLVARPPHKRVMDYNTSGIWMPVGGGVFKSSTTTTFIFGLENGKLWQLASDGGTPTEITLSSANALTAGNQIDVVQYFGDPYVVDKVRQLKLNLSTGVATNITAKLPSDITKPFRQIFWQNRYWVCDEDGRLASSQQEANIQTDASPYDTTGSAFSTPVSDNDGQVITNIVSSNRILMINKSLSRDKIGSTYTITGTSDADFRLDQISPTTTFLGKSAVAIGGDLFGLTQSGFRFLSSVQQLGETPTDVTSLSGASFETRKVPDWVLDLIKGVNPNYAHLIVGIYNQVDNSYYCSIPYGVVVNKNNIVIRVDFTDGQIRYSIFTDTFAQVFFQKAGFIYFLDDKGRIWKMLDHNQATYEEQQYHKLLVTKAYNFNTLSTSYYINSIIAKIKAFKDDKTFNMFYKAYRTNMGSKIIEIESNKKGTVANVGERTIEQKISKFTSNYDFTITDIDNVDNALFRTAEKELKVGENVETIQAIISEQIRDTTGKNIFELQGIRIKAKPIREAP